MVAAACLFLACKIEEHPRRLTDLINGIQRLFKKANESVGLTREVCLVLNLDLARLFKLILGIQTL